MSKHTPGPWVVAAGKMGAGMTTICDYAPPHGPYRKIAECITDRGVSVDAANARLIAAAPELLAALRVLMAAHVDGAALPHVAGPAWEAARAAIAKATGGEA